MHNQPNMRLHAAPIYIFRVHEMPLSRQKTLPFVPFYCGSNRSCKGKKRERERGRDRYSQKASRQLRQTGLKVNAAFTSTTRRPLPRENSNCISSPRTQPPLFYFFPQPTTRRAGELERQARGSSVQGALRIHKQEGKRK